MSQSVRKINNPDMNAQDRTLPDVTSRDPATGLSFCASQVQKVLEHAAKNRSPFIGAFNGSLS